MSPDLQARLLRLFENHDVELEADEDWLLTDGDFPALRAQWKAGGSGQAGRLDIDVVLDEERQLELSYAGIGPDDALERFTRSDLPLLLAACWYVTDDRKLDLAQWEIGVRTWDAFIGRFTVDGADAAVPPTAAAAIADALRNEALEARLHWIRVFLRRESDGALSSEVLLDNQPWPAGDRALAALAWPSSATPYSVRNLMVLDVRDY